MRILFCLTVCLTVLLLLRDIKRKATKAASLLKKVDNYHEGVTDSNDRVKDTMNQLNSDDYHNVSDIESGVRDVVGTHNSRSGAIFSKVKGAKDQLNKDNESKSIVGGNDSPEEKEDSAENKRVRAAKAYNRYARSKITQGDYDYKEARLDLITASDHSIADAQSDFNQGNPADASIALEMAALLTDTALDFIPGIGLAKDAIEAATGKSLVKAAFEAVSGQKLETLEDLSREEQVLTAGGILLGGGYGDNFGKAALKLTRIVKKIRKSKGKSDEIVDQSGKVLDSAGKAGLGADDIKPFVDQLGKVGRTSSRNTPDEIAGAFANGRASGNLDRTLSRIDDPQDLVDFRRDHILNRHRAGAGKPGKTEFPSDWDDTRIMHQVSDVATDPKSIRGSTTHGEYVIGYRDGILIRVNFYPQNHPTYPGKISTGFPMNTTPNP